MCIHLDHAITYIQVTCIQATLIDPENFWSPLRNHWPVLAQVEWIQGQHPSGLLGTLFFCTLLLY